MELQGSESDCRDAEVICPLERGQDPVANFIGNFAGSIDFAAFAQDDVEPLEPAEPRIRKSIARAIRGPARWVDVAVWLHRYRASLGFAAAISQKANEFLTCVELCARWLVSIEIAYETNAEGDIVQIIAVHMTAVYLTPPSIADFDLAVAG